MTKESSSPNWSLAWGIAAFCFSQAITAGATYAAIRADLAETKVRAEMTEKRVDRIENQVDKLRR